MQTPDRAPSTLGSLRLALIALGLAALVAGCGGTSSADRPVSTDAVEIALYEAILDRSVTATGAAADELAGAVAVEISCSTGSFGGWICSVLLDNDSRLSCAVDLVRTETGPAPGRARCR